MMKLKQSMWACVFLVACGGEGMMMSDPGVVMSMDGGAATGGAAGGSGGVSGSGVDGGVPGTGGAVVTGGAPGGSGGAPGTGGAGSGGSGGKGSGGTGGAHQDAGGSDVGKPDGMGVEELACGRPIVQVTGCAHQAPNTRWVLEYKPGHRDPCGICYTSAPPNAQFVSGCVDKGSYANSPTGSYLCVTSCGECTDTAP